MIDQMGVLSSNALDQLGWKSLVVSLLHGLAYFLAIKSCVSSNKEKLKRAHSLNVFFIKFIILANSLPSTLPIISIKLNGNNYYFWKKIMILLLRSYKRLGYMVGSIPGLTPKLLSLKKDKKSRSYPIPIISSGWSMTNLASPLSWFQQEQKWGFN